MGLPLPAASVAEIVDRIRLQSTSTGASEEYLISLRSLTWFSKTRLSTSLRWHWTSFALGPLLRIVNGSKYPGLTSFSILSLRKAAKLAGQFDKTRLQVARESPRHKYSKERTSEGCVLQQFSTISQWALGHSIASTPVSPHRSTLLYNRQANVRPEATSKRSGRCV